MSVEPYRGTFGDPRPARLRALPLPPQPMPPRHGTRPLHAWRYVAVFCEELMLCAASVRIGPLRQSFWAVWNRETRELTERTALGGGQMRCSLGRLRVPRAGIDLTLVEEAGIETVSPADAAFSWTRKQGGIRAHGTVGGRTIEARAIVDDTAAYYPRHTRWYWAAGVGTTVDGRSAAWNLVDGVNDGPRASERTVWIEGRPSEPAAERFAPDLSGVGDLVFTAETERVRNENRLLVRSRYRQPFGTVRGQLPDGTELLRGLGVMEHHDVAW